MKKITEKDGESRINILRQISNISYPKVESNYGNSGLKQIFTIDKYKYKYKQEYKNYLHINNLENVSIKIHNLIQTIKLQLVLYLYIHNTYQVV